MNSIAVTYVTPGQLAELNCGIEASAPPEPRIADDELECRGA